MYLFQAIKLSPPYLGSTLNYLAFQLFVFYQRNIRQINLKTALKLLREAHVLRHVNGHENIIRLHNIFVGDTVIFLVFELCPNGELFDFLTGIVSLPEGKARTVMTQLFGALKHCHELGVVHREEGACLRLFWPLLFEKVYL